MHAIESMPVQRNTTGERQDFFPALVISEFVTVFMYGRAGVRLFARVSAQDGADRL